MSEPWATEPATAAVRGGIALLERSLGYLLGVLPLVDEAALTRATPCTRWDVRALLRHLDEGLAALDEAVVVGRIAAPRPGWSAPAQPPPVGSSPAQPPPVGSSPAQPLVAGLRLRACGMLGDWVGTGEDTRSGGAAGPAVVLGDRRLTLPLVAAAGAIEIAVHTWDLARGCGGDHPLPPALARELLDLAPLLVGRADRPGRFAPAVHLPVTARAGDAERLLAFLGRDPR